MTSVVELREPLRSFITKLDAFELSSRGGEIVQCGSIFGGLKLPELDAEDARDLAAELNAAMLPIIKRFRDRKLRELTGMQPAGTAVMAP